MFVRLIDNNIEITNVILGGMISDQKEMVKKMYLVYKEDKSKLDKVWDRFF